MRLHTEQKFGAGEVEPSDDSTVSVDDLVLTCPRRQATAVDATLDESLEPRVGNAATSLAAVE